MTKLKNQRSLTVYARRFARTKSGIKNGKKMYTTCLMHSPMTSKDHK